jgi:DNA repair protein RadA/Sms
MYICSECWNESLKWAWQCAFCKAWGTLKEFKETKLKTSKKAEVLELKTLDNIETNTKKEKIETKSQELNNVLWWWIVPWSLVLLTWEPGIWKSTLSLQIANFVENKKIIYISWEETEYQIASRAKRFWIKNKNLLLLSETNIENILETLSKNHCDILIIDSISVIYSESIEATAWSISQIKYITELLMHFAKKTNTATFIIWHINKEWNIAGPKTLEHMVDTVLFFEWDKFDNLRILRSLKNRFWDTSETWLFKMLEKGLEDIKNPWLEFINSKDDTIGSSLSITIEWTRPIVIETESLTTYTKFGYPKRSARWIKSSKLDLIIAVLGKYTNINLDSYDVYSNISRWLKIEEPWIDLSLAVSIISSKTNKIIPKTHIFIWEISLTWIIKTPIFLEKRIKEAKKLGFEKIYIPNSSKIKSEENIIKLKNISDLIKTL